jgi:TPR repeat protein
MLGKHYFYLLVILCFNLGGRLTQAGCTQGPFQCGDLPPFSAANLVTTSTLKELSQCYAKATLFNSKSSCRSAVFWTQLKSYTQSVEGILNKTEPTMKILRRLHYAQAIGYALKSTTEVDNKSLKQLSELIRGALEKSAAAGFGRAHFELGEGYCSGAFSNRIDQQKANTYFQSAASAPEPFIAAGESSRVYEREPNV